MTQGAMFSLLETLQLVALLPCLFAVALLVFLHRDWREVLVPLLFFLSLAASFLAGIVPAAAPDNAQEELLAGLVWIESLQPALCFLLIIQLWRNRFPPPVYWLILALPVLGGSSLLYASLRLEEVCLWQGGCLEAGALRTLYFLFATSLIFLLLMAHLGRVPIASQPQNRYQSHRYWLILSLVVLFLGLLMTDLALLGEAIRLRQHALIHVVIRLAFLYLALTSLFRVFDAQAGARQETAPAPIKPVDPDIVAAIRAAMERDKLYREMGFNRERCAQALGLGEHVLSRAINQAFGQNFNEFINRYRVEEAKQRLSAETTSITVIAFEVGFSSIASFNRVFKALAGRSPTEYRAASQPEALSK